MSVRAFFLLSSLAITAQAQNCSKPVGKENMNLKGDAILKETFPNGTRVSFACDVGYKPAGGSPFITCTSGVWSDLKLLCERKNCGPIAEVDNAEIHYSEGTEFGATAVISCRHGYILVGKREIHCGDQGWMDRLPVCEVVTCRTPSTVEKGIFNPFKEVYNYEDVVVYSCEKDYILKGSKELTCSRYGNFSNPAPECVSVSCEDFTIPNGKFDSGSRPPHKYKATMTFVCNDYHKMIGSATVTCGLDGQWFPQIPECKAVSTIKPTTTATTTTTTTTSSNSGNKGPTDNGNPLSVGAIVGLCLVGCAVLGVGVFYVLRKKKKSTRGGNTDKEAAKDGEDIRLS